MERVSTRKSQVETRMRPGVNEAIERVIMHEQDFDGGFWNLFGKMLNEFKAYLEQNPDWYPHSMRMSCESRLMRYYMEDIVEVEILGANYDAKHTVMFFNIIDWYAVKNGWIES
jgi:hypothetical protein